MSSLPLPPTAAWQHLHAREGFEVAFVEGAERGFRLHGCTAAVEEGLSWVIAYDIACDRNWRTHRARITATSVAGTTCRLLDTDGQGAWTVDGVAAPGLAGCLDVDLESSALTNTLPVHRMSLKPGETREAPAAYVRAPGLSVRRLEQTYARDAAGEGGPRYCYVAPEFDYRAQLVFDDAGLVLDYPGIARRVC